MSGCRSWREGQQSLATGQQVQEASAARCMVQGCWRDVPAVLTGCLFRLLVDHLLLILTNCRGSTSTHCASSTCPAHALLSPAEYVSAICAVCTQSMLARIKQEATCTAEDVCVAPCHTSPASLQACQADAVERAICRTHLQRHLAGRSSSFPHVGRRCAHPGSQWSRPEAPWPWPPIQASPKPHTCTQHRQHIMPHRI